MLLGYIKILSVYLYPYLRKRESCLWTDCFALIKALIDDTENTSSLEKEIVFLKDWLYLLKKTPKFYLKETKPSLLFTDIVG